jgi:hypothetical protein
MTRPAFVHCPVSGKRGFTSPSVAKRRSRGVGHRIRAYRCEACGRFHVAKAVR